MLPFAAVFVQPHLHLGPAALSEERRLLHVAITRARDKVLINWAARRTFGERSSRRSRSPYLDHVDGSDQLTLPTKAETSTQKARRHLSGVAQRRQ